MSEHGDELFASDESAERVATVDVDDAGAVVEPVGAREPNDGEAEPVDGEGEDGWIPLAPRLARWWRRLGQRLADDPGRIAEALVSIAAVSLATALVVAALRPSQWLSNTTPTGGDMGSHLWGPRYLLDHLLPHFRLSGWTPDWYDGFPAYQFYMVVPSLIVVAIHVGLPWWLVVPALAGCAVVAAAGWIWERLYRYRRALLALGLFLAVLAVPVSYNRAFKITTALGLLALPAACWAFAKLADFPFPVPPLAAGAGAIFLFNLQPVFNNTGNIIGGNFTSTMAGEFAFSISLTFAVLYLGVAVRGLRTGRHRALAATLFALAGLCHLIPAFFVLGCTGALFLVHPDRKRLRWLLTMVPVAGLLTAFWVVPFLLRADYVNDMGWEQLPVPNAEVASVSYYLWPKALFWLLVFGLVGVVVSLVRKRPAGLVLGMAWAGVAVGFALLPQWRLWNARLLPFMYLSVSLLAAIALGELIHLAATAAAGDARRPLRAVSVGAGLLALFGTFVYVALPLDGVQIRGVHKEVVTDPVTGAAVTRSSFALTPKVAGHQLALTTTAVNPAPGWSNYNYRGLELKEAAPAGCDAPGSTVACSTGGWKEYRHLVQTMAGLGEDPRNGCGRSMWEYDGPRIGGYGTPMALMMFPYFTDGCIGSQEGLYFESSATVPYHFYMQAELSTQGSNPQRDLVYPTLDLDTGVRHMQLLGVKYYLASTSQAIDAASRHPDLTEVADSGPWHIYRVRNSATVSPLRYQPVVARGIDESQQGWLPTMGAWFLDPNALDVPLTDRGPAAWKRTDAHPVPEAERRFVIWARGQLGYSGAIDKVPGLPRVPLPKVRVSHIRQGRDTISFDVSEVGVPVLVKTSYFPNWKASGADGPYRASPNLMIVVPRAKHVSLHYERTPVDYLGIGLTLLGIVGLVLLLRSRPVAVAEPRESRLSRWLDEVITIPPTPPRAERGRFRRAEPMPGFEDLEADHDAPAEIVEGEEPVEGDER